MNLPAFIHVALVDDQARAYAAQAGCAERKPISHQEAFADRVLNHPNPGDRFTATRKGITFGYEVDAISYRSVYFNRWLPNQPESKSTFCCSLTQWTDRLKTAKIEEMK